MDPEGYVLTHQHFSHAHDHGWPFPLWTQSDRTPEGVKEKTAGWHFQKGPVRGWVRGYLEGWKDPSYQGEAAVARWGIECARSLGIQDERWRIEATGPSPALLTPQDARIDAFNAPFLQLRWMRTGTPRDHRLPYIEWMREGDPEFGADRRMYFDLQKTPLSGDMYHSIIPAHRHPLWRGTIRRIRISLAPGESDVRFDIDSFFTAYDTRHTINNPVFILASWLQFVWTGDLEFLRRNIDRMRLALRYQQKVMGGLRYQRIRNPWPGHDGLAGFARGSEGRLTVLGGHGIGSNYWDLLPFGGDDFYATCQYYAATRATADLEEAIRANPGWPIPLGALALDPAALRAHAERMKEEANRLFWSEETGRFIGCIDVEGKPHDYGFTFVNLDAIWYGIASDAHARAILDWLTGRRIVDGDTSTGADIYRWRFGPRATTRRNIDWYGQGWHAPESIPWGGQVQDGGAVLGFTFYDLWARLRILGPDDAWRRLCEILAWEEDVWRAGGYRAYYMADGKRGTTLQGGGTAGGIGIDAEFFESSLLPSIIPYAFLGLDPRPDRLIVRPRLPDACPEMGIANILYRRVRMDVRATREEIALVLHDGPGMEIRILPEGADEPIVLAKAGAYRFERRA